MASSRTDAFRIYIHILFSSNSNPKNDDASKNGCKKHLFDANTLIASCVRVRGTVECTRKKHVHNFSWMKSSLKSTTFAICVESIRESELMQAAQDKTGHSHICESCQDCTAHSVQHIQKGVKMLSLAYNLIHTRFFMENLHAFPRHCQT